MLVCVKGDGEDLKALNSVEKYSAESNTWSEVASLQVVLAGHFLEAVCSAR